MKENLKSITRLLIQLNTVISKKQKKKAVWVFITMVICSYLELLGVGILVPFITMLTDMDSLKNQWYSSWIFDIYPDITNTMLVIFLCLAFVLVYVIKNGFMIYSSYVQTVYATSFNKENSVKMLDSYMKRPYEFFTNTNSSVMMRGINTDVAGTYSILIDFFGVFSEMLSIAMIGIYLLITDWVIAISVLFIASVCMLSTIVLFKGKMKRAGKKNEEATMRRGETSYRAINGIKEITVLDRRRMFVQAFDDATEEEKKANITRSFLSACPDRLLEAVCIGGFMVVICMRILSYDNYAGIIPILGVFAMGAFRVLPSFSRISSRVNDMVFYMPCLQNCCDNFIEAAKYDAEDIERQKKLEEVSSKYDDNLPFVSELSIKNVSWHYLNSEKDVLDDLSIDIKKGDAVAFIGPSGAGKTTLADIIMGLYQPQAGSVMMDGISIYDIPHRWARIIGYVPQSVFLIDASVRKNIAFGVLDSMIDDDKVWAALEQAHLKEFVESLPEGLDTVVGERGVKFSGGQRQRVAIARALYEEPEILVLDEATSALDNETEQAVMESIEALSGKKTLIIIAHRLSTIRKCNKIYEINNGVAVLKEKSEVL